MIKVGNVIKISKDIFNESDGSLYLKSGQLLLVDFLLPFKFSDGIHASNPNSDKKEMYRLDIDDIGKLFTIVAETPDEWNTSQIAKRRENKINKILK